MAEEYTALHPRTALDQIPTRPIRRIDHTKIRYAVLLDPTTVTTNYFAREKDIKLAGKSTLAGTEVKYLSDFDEPKAQGYVNVKTDTESFAVKCITSSKYSRRERNRHDERHHQVTALRKYSKIKDPIQKDIYARAVNHENTPAWEDYEVQNYIRYIREGHENILKLHGFSQWYQYNDIEDGLLMLYFDYCDAGTLLDYTQACYKDRVVAVEPFIIDHVGFQLASVAVWLHGHGRLSVRPKLLHRNIRPENVFLQMSPGSEWPNVKLGGFEKLTPFTHETEMKDLSHQRTPFDSTAFPELSQEGDEWAIGVCLYTALCFGHYPPKAGITSNGQLLEEPLMQHYTSGTYRILGGLLASDREHSLTSSGLIEFLSRNHVVYTSALDQIDWRPKHVADEQLSCDPREQITNYIASLRSRTTDYFHDLHTSVCNGEVDHDLYNDMIPTAKDLGAEIFNIFKEWFTSDKAEPSFDEHPKKEADFLARNINKVLELTGKNVWLITRARFMVIPYSRRHRYLRPSKTPSTAVIVHTEKFITSMQPLIEDVFWRVARQWVDPVLDGYPSSKLPASDLFEIDVNTRKDCLYMDQEASAGSGKPSREELASNLQNWIVEQCFRGLIDATRVGVGEMAVVKIMRRTLADVKTLFEDWYQWNSDGPDPEWIDLADTQFSENVPLVTHGFVGERPPLSDARLLRLYETAEDLARKLVPISTRCLRILRSPDNITNHNHMVRLLGEIQRNWRKHYVLAPPLKESDLRETLPTAQPIFTDDYFDEAVVKRVKEYTSGSIKESFELWKHHFSEARKEINILLEELEDQQTDTNFSRRLYNHACEVAKRVVVNLQEGLTDPVHISGAAIRTFDAASKSIYKVLKLYSHKDLSWQRRRIMSDVFDKLWPYVYVAPICRRDRLAIHSSFEAMFKKACNNFSTYDPVIHNDQAIYKLYDAFQEKAGSLFEGLKGSLGYPDGVSPPAKSFHLRKALLMRKVFEDYINAWINERDDPEGKTIEARAIEFADDVNRRCDREWAHYLENFIDFIVSKVDPIARRNSSNPDYFIHVGVKPVANKERTPSLELSQPQQTREEDAQAEWSLSGSKANPTFDVPPTPRTPLTSGIPASARTPLASGITPASPVRPASDITTSPEASPARSERYEYATSFGWSDGGEDEVSTYTTPQSPDFEPAERTHAASGNAPPPAEYAADPREVMKTIKLPRSLEEFTRREFESLEANAQIIWPITSLEKHNQLVRAEILRSTAYPLSSLSKSWNTQRIYTEIPDSKEVKRLDIIGRDGRIVRTRDWIDEMAGAVVGSTPSPPSSSPPHGSPKLTPERQRRESLGRQTVINLDSDDDDVGNPLPPPVTPTRSTPGKPKDSPAKQDRVIDIDDDSDQGVRSPPRSALSSGRSKGSTPKQVKIISLDIDSDDIGEPVPPQPAKSKHTPSVIEIDSDSDNFIRFPADTDVSEPRIKRESNSTSYSTKRHESPKTPPNRNPGKILRVSLRGETKCVANVLEGIANTGRLSHDSSRNPRKRLSTDSSSQSSKRPKLWSDVPDGQASKSGIIHAVKEVSGFNAVVNAVDSGLRGAVGFLTNFSPRSKSEEVSKPSRDESARVDRRTQSAPSRKNPKRRPERDQVPSQRAQETFKTPGPYRPQGPVQSLYQLLKINLGDSFEPTVKDYQAVWERISQGDQDNFKDTVDPHYHPDTIAYLYYIQARRFVMQAMSDGRIPNPEDQEQTQAGSKRPGGSDIEVQDAKRSRMDEDGNSQRGILQQSLSHGRTTTEELMTRTWGPPIPLNLPHTSQYRSGPLSSSPAITKKLGPSSSNFPLPWPRNPSSTKVMPMQITGQVELDMSTYEDIRTLEDRRLEYIEDSEEIEEEGDDKNERDELISRRKSSSEMQEERQRIWKDLPKTGGTKAKRLTAADLWSSHAPLSDDEQFQHDDERYKKQTTLTTPPSTTRAKQSTKSPPTTSAKQSVWRGQRSSGNSSSNDSSSDDNFGFRAKVRKIQKSNPKSKFDFKSHRIMQSASDTEGESQQHIEESKPKRKAPNEQRRAEVLADLKATARKMRNISNEMRACKGTSRWSALRDDQAAAQAHHFNLRQQVFDEELGLVAADLSSEEDTVHRERELEKLSQERRRLKSELERLKDNSGEKKHSSRFRF